MSLPVSQWEKTDKTQQAKPIISCLFVVNDAAERALGLARDTNTKTYPQTEAELRTFYKVNKGVRES